MQNKRKKNPAAHSRSKARKNPAIRVSSRKHHTGTPRRRNPNRTSSSVAMGASALKSGLIALVGLVITRQLPQMALGAKNTGIMGYLANVVAMLVASAGASRLAGSAAGASVAVGGGLYIANRVLSEQFSPIGKYLSLSGVGDAHAASPAQLAGIRPAYFPMPVTYSQDGQPQIPDLINQAISKNVPAPPASKMAGYRMGAR